ncbi:MAG TPA: FtsX-like permease family protein [Solirubrobacteraceae bacterium]|nr:FtsX-like permease family protein [Solirubrobacteraceae bacterium]
MTRLTLKSLASRKLRTALTAMAVVLGVAMISGTYILTDTIDRAFGDIFQQAAEGVDVAVTPRQAVDNGVQETPMDAALLERVKAVPGVAEARGDVFRNVTVVDDENEPVSTGGVPTFVSSAAPGRFEAFDPVEGRLPRADGEIAVDKGTAEEQGFELGETVRVLGDDGIVPLRLVGIAKYGSVDSLAGATVVLTTLRRAQGLTGTEGKFDTIAAAGEGGTSAETLRDRVKAALRGAPVDVRTGEENAEADTKDTQEGLGFLRTALLIFGGIAVFVGAFVISNTFSITVAQRTGELALLRTLGASRRQVLRSVILEAALLGVGASILGLIGGLLVAPGIVLAFKAAGLDLPADDTVLLGRTVFVSLLVGIGVTVVASVAPALRATRVPPIAAMRAGVGLPVRSGRKRFVFAGLLAVVGMAAVLSGLFGGSEGGDAAGQLGLGAAVVFLAVALFSPQLVRPLARVVGAPFERLGLTGRLARENATRQPGRTAATAAALMIGLALVTFVSIFAAGFRASIDDIVDQQFAGELTVRNKDGFSPLPAATRGAVRAVPGVESATGVRFGMSLVNGDETVTFGVDPADLTKGYKLEWEEGDARTLAGMRGDETVVAAPWAKDEGVKVGDTLNVTTTTGEQRRLKVIGSIDEDESGLLGGGILVANDQMARHWDEQRDAFLFLTFADGAKPATVRAGIDRVLDDQFPVAESQDREEVKDAQAGQINQILYLFYALLALSIIVSLFGVVNTLTLSIHERTRELGMLRAIGTSRRQVRRTVRYEAAITAMIGAVLGLVLGIFFAWIVTQPLIDEGFAFELPVATMVGLFVLAALAGVVSAVLPARRAARVDILRALAYE